MAPWAQWFINNNLRYLLYIVAVVYAPFAILAYIIISTIPELAKEIVRDFKSIATANKTK